MKRFPPAAAVALASLILAVPAHGITKGGELDGEAHPYVGLMVAYDEDETALWLCTGTLVSPTVFLTAGHCTSGAASARIWFDSDVDQTGYPNADVDAEGTPRTYDAYRDEAFFVNDLGLVELDEEIAMATYGELPAIGAVDALGKGRKKSAVTTVGYGVQFVGRGALPNQDERIRFRAESFIVNTKGAAGTGTSHGMNSMTLSGSANGGGACFGDSGGPTFVAGTNTVIGVTSYAGNPLCAGTAGVYRIDHADALEWLTGYIEKDLDAG